MENKNWEESLKDMLRDYEPEGLQPDWDSFSDYLSVHEEISQWEENEVFDESIKDSIIDFRTPDSVKGWDLIEADLNAEHQFDEKIRNHVNHYNPEYNNTWPMLLRRLSGLGYLRAKLIAFKVVEVAAIILILFTVVKMGQMGKLPFESPLLDKLQAFVIPSSDSNSLNSPNHSLSTGISQATDKNATSTRSLQILDGTIVANTPEVNNNNALPASASKEGSGIERQTIVFKPILNDVHPLFAQITENPEVIDVEAAIPEIEDKKDRGSGKSIFKKLQVSNFLSSILSPVRGNNHNSLPKLAYIKSPSRTYTEFGIISQVDQNLLQIPEDRLYSFGHQIVFPEKGIKSSSMGGGFSLALAHPRWALETGMIYSEKNFKPGRKLTVGTQGGTIAFGKVEFTSMKLQLVSVPIQFRYKADNKGNFHVYGLSGLSLHLIAQTDIDVAIDIPSLSAAGNANSDYFSSTNRETKRIREHIVDGAPFSTKSFISLNAGAGIEYILSEHKTLFLQSAIQYQVPNLKFSNNNGKHLQALSLQLGVRTPLGN